MPKGLSEILRGQNEVKFGPFFTSQIQNIPKDPWKGLIVTLNSANIVLLNNSGGWNSATYCHKFHHPGLLKPSDKNTSAH